MITVFISQLANTWRRNTKLIKYEEKILSFEDSSQPLSGENFL